MSDTFRALLVNCSLKASEDRSNTQVLLDKIAGLFATHDVATEVVRFADLTVPAGISVEKSGDGDDFPPLYAKVKAADIFVVGTPIWFGHRSSLCQRLLERLNGSMSETDAMGRMPFFGKVAGCVVTGNEDGAHNACAATLFNLTHIGFTVPPMADCYWNGPAGPGKSYVAAGGDKHLYTNKTARYLAATLSHAAHVLRANPYEVDYNALTREAKDESDSKSQEFFED